MLVEDFKNQLTTTKLLISYNPIRAEYECKVRRSLQNTPDVSPSKVAGDRMEGVGLSYYEP